MKHIAVYMRVSTDAQSTDSQEHELRRYLESRGVNPNNRSLVAWYVDKISGDQVARPSLKKLKKNIERGLVSEVVVWKLDRLSRRMIDGINTIHKWLESDVALVSVTQQFDFRGPIGKAVAALLLALAEEELNNIRDRIRAGISRARANGKKWGGWPKGKRRKRRLTPRAMSIAENMWLQGFPASTIADNLGINEKYVFRIAKQLGWRTEAKMAQRMNNRREAARLRKAKSKIKRQLAEENEAIDVEERLRNAIMED